MLLLLAYSIAILILYCDGTISNSLFYFQFPFCVICFLGFIPAFTYPVVYEDTLEMRWMLLPLLNRRFGFNDINKILFLRRQSSGGNFTVTIFTKDGRKHKYYCLQCMEFEQISVFMKQLQSLGVNVENKMRFKDE